MRIAAVILLSIALAACSGKTSGSNPVSTAPSDTSISFSSQVQPIFTTNCALSGCHAGSSPQRGQNLSAGEAYSNIVDVSSVENPDYYRVKPYSADSSYLYLKITGSPLITGVKMPYYKTPLSQPEINTIRQWIEEGAKNN